MNRGWQLVVRDPSWLSGPAVAEVISNIADGVGARFVVVGEVEGRGEVRGRLLSPDLLVFSVEELVDLSRKMIQFEWGDFFLLRTGEEAGLIHEEDSYPAQISESLVVIRCVDNTYFYVYGTDAATRATVVERLDISESKEGLLAELDYPW